MPKANIGLIGLGVMGQNLALNIESKGFTVACFNRTISRVNDFVNSLAKCKNIIACHSLQQLIDSLSKPRKILLMVKAGPPVDETIESLLHLLDDGDIIIDGGNSHFLDTIRRTKSVESSGKLYIGTGISGGEEGALKGPSIMPGGSESAWQHIEPVFKKIAAKAPDGQPCCHWIGSDGAGHFVKMVHNAIEYGDMQLIAETYHIMRTALALPNKMISQIFCDWNKENLSSYLIEITSDILAYTDKNGSEVIDLILDVASQKGTGKWTALSSLDLGQPFTLAAEAVFARYLSAMKSERVEASEILKGPRTKFSGSHDAFLEDLKCALYASKIVCYAQGFSLMKAASREYNWKLDYGSIASLWRAGCIIRSVFLDRIKDAFDKNPALGSLMLAPFFCLQLENCQYGWRNTSKTAFEMGVPVPAIASALTYYDGFRCEKLPANLIASQRDYFGAHTYQRIDKPPQQSFHTDWKTPDR